MSSELQPASCWEAIDGIVLINLDRHPERWEHFRREVGSRLPLDRLHRLSAVEGVCVPGYGEKPWFTETTGERARFWGGTAGCALSHRRAVEMAKQQQWRHVLVLEDDAAMREVSEPYNRVLSQALQQLQGPYMLYLGYNKPLPCGRCLQCEREASLWRIEGVLATHAYLIPAAMYDYLLERLPHEDNVWEWLSIYRAVDVFYRDFVAGLEGIPIYSIQPQLFFQGDFASCITPGAMAGNSFRCDDELPRSLSAVASCLHRLMAPLRRLKIRLNSLRTHRRALRGGLPGYRKTRAKVD